MAEIKTKQTEINPAEFIDRVENGQRRQDGHELATFVALIPESSRLQNRALFQSVVTDDKGRYVLRGVAPGAYTLYAWESIPLNAYQNTGFLAKYNGRGQDVRVIPNARLEVPERAPD